MTLTTRIEQAGEGAQRELLEAELKQCARESGWPDDLLFGLVELALKQGILKAGESG